jgi:hypothetical protein
MAVFLSSLAASDYANGKMNPGIYYRGNQPGIPSSGMPDRFAWLDPRFGLSYDVFGNGHTLVRGGWGLYRFADQYNDYANELTTAQSILTYTLPNNTSVEMSQIPSIAAPGTVCGPATAPGGKPCTNGSVYALNPTDYSLPLSEAWNLTVSQQLPANTLLEVAYVGNHSENIPLGGETINGSGFTDFDNLNKIPKGALFQPDPVTGLVARNPEDVTSTCAGAVCNKTSDYRPYGREYGDNGVYVLDTAGYSNYHALQVSAVRTSTRATLNANYTFSKTLATYNHEDAFDLHRNYGISPYDRRHVFNFSGSYTLMQPYRGQEHLLRGVANGWTFSTVTTLQSGGNLQAISGSPNFNMNLQYGNYNGAPISSGNPLPNGATGNSLSSATYYGTNATVAVTPVVTCDPRSHTGNRQRIQYSCFAPPPLHQYGWISYPYTMAPFFDTSVSMFKSFPVVHDQSVVFRVDAFNFINHPLPQYSGGSQLTLAYRNTYGTSNFAVNPSGFPGSNPANFGVMDTKSGDPMERIIALSIKYLF